MLTKPMHLIAAAILAAVFPGSAYTQSYPSRPIRLVVGSAPSGAVDIVSRVVAERLTAALGQPVIVDNRPGAEATIAYDAIAKASADGYTLVAVTDSITILPSIYRKLSFDPQTSFTPIILMSTQPLVLAACRGTRGELQGVRCALQVETGHAVVCDRGRTAAPHG